MALLSGFDQLNQTSDTFSDWLNKTNELILLTRGDDTGAQTSFMTANSLPGGSMTYGNATLFGQFSANAVVIFNEGLAPSSNAYANGSYGGLRGGNWVDASNSIVTDTLYITSNTTFTDEAVEVYVNTTYGLIVEANVEARHDVLFVGNGGSNTNPKMHWEDTDNILSFNNDVRAIFGKDLFAETAGGTTQYEMFYTGGRMYSNTDVQDIRATANLNLITDEFELRTETGNELMLTANVADGVVLYWDNSAKLTTNTNGIYVHGDAIVEDNVVVFDNNKILMGGTTPYTGGEAIADYNFQIYTDGTDGIIVSGGNDLLLKVDDNFVVQNEAGTINLINANTSGEVTLYHNNVAKLQTNTAGIEVYGEANTSTARILGDANFDGSDGLDSNNIFWDSSANTLYIRDDSPINIGDGSDLSIYHDSNTEHSYITESNANGSLYIQANNFVLEDTDGTDYISMTANGGVTITHDGNVKITTTSIGVNIEGEANTDTLRVQGNVDFESDAVSTNEDALTWTASTRIFNWNDNAKATFGTDGDLEIYFDNTGNNSIIKENGTGSLYIQANNFVLEDTDGTDYISMTANGGVTITHDGNVKITTTSIGVDVEGEANTDTLRVQGDAQFENGSGTDKLNWEASNGILNFENDIKATFGSGDELQIYYSASGNNSFIGETATGNLVIEATNLILRATDDSRYLEGIDGTGTRLYSPDDTIALVANNNQIYITDLANTSTLRVRSTSLFEGSIDIEGSTNGNTLTWTKSSNTLNFDDNNFATFGTGGDLIVYHDASDSYIKNMTGELYIQGDGITLQSDDANSSLIETFLTADLGGAVTLYWDNAAKLQTNTNGIEVTGQVIASAGFVTYNDQKIEMGGTEYANDHLFEIYTDGSNSYITETGGGDLNIQANNLILEATDGTNYFVATSGANTTIHHGNGTKILELRTNGVNIIGEANTDTLRVKSTSYLEQSVFFDGTDPANSSIAVADQLVWEHDNNILQWKDSVKATFGTGDNLSIYHATNSYIENITGDLYITNDATDKNIHIRTDDGSDGLTDYIVADGSTTELKLYHGGNQKLITKTGGVVVTGNVVADGFVAGDGEKIQLGASQDLQIYHEATGNTIIKETGSNSLVIQGNNIILETTAGGDYINMVNNGAVTLNWRGTSGGARLETDQAGVNIKGTLDVENALTVTSTASFNGNVDLGNAIDDTITFNGYVDSDIIPNSNTSHDLGTASLSWNNLYLDSTLYSDAITTSTISADDVDVTGDVSANTFTGNGAALTSLNATALTSGTVSDDRLPNQITSNISGTAAQANTISVNDDNTNQDYKVSFSANTGAYRQQYTASDDSFIFNPSSGTLTVDNLIVNNETTLTANITFGDVTSFTNIEVANNATILNLEVTSLEANNVAFTGTGEDVTSAATTVIDSFPINQTRGFKYFVHGLVTNDDTKGYAVEINVITTDTGADTNVFYTRYGEVESGMSDVVISPALAANNTHIDLLATCDSASGAAIHRFKVLKIETRTP